MQSPVLHCILDALNDAEEWGDVWWLADVFEKITAIGPRDNKVTTVL